MKNTSICFNGTLINASLPIVSANNRGFKYGDGFFETIRVMDNRIILKDFHFKRLFASLKVFKFDSPANFTSAYLEETILQLVQINKLSKHARVRINIFRGDGSLYHYENNLLHFIIEAEELSNKNYYWNKDGITIDFFTEAKKICDTFSPIKSNSFLPYNMAAIWAKQNNLDDAILLNQYNTIADTTIANIWIVSNGIIKTPPLSQGCIDGVMRKHIIQKIKEEGLPFKETEITIDELLQAQEIFLTNVIKGIQWVKQCNKNEYTQQTTPFIFSKFIEPLNRHI